MTQETYITLNTIMSILDGLLNNARAKSIQREQNLKEDPRSNFARLVSNPVTKGIMGAGLSAYTDFAWRHGNGNNIRSRS